MQILSLISFSSAFIEVEAVQVRGCRKRLFIRSVEKVSTPFLNLSNAFVLGFLRGAQRRAHYRSLLRDGF